jgi:hypothetical protein
MLLELGRELEANQCIAVGLKWCVAVGDQHAANELRSLKTDEY